MMHYDTPYAMPNDHLDLAMLCFLSSIVVPTNRPTYLN